MLIISVKNYRITFRLVFKRHNSWGKGNLPTVSANPDSEKKHLSVLIIKSHVIILTTNSMVFGFSLIF